MTRLDYYSLFHKSACAEKIERFFQVRVQYDDSIDIKVRPASGSSWDFFLFFFLQSTSSKQIIIAIMRRECSKSFSVSCGVSSDF